MTAFELDACIGASDPNDFTVREVPRSSVAAFTSTAPCPSFATMANAPLMGQDAGVLNWFYPAAKAEYFFAKGSTHILG